MRTADPENLTHDQRIVIEPGTVAHQQFLDGRALHRLRDALPSYVITIRADVTAYGRGWLVSAEDGPDWAFYALEDTIAAAADKCREAAAPDADG